MFWVKCNYFPIFVLIRTITAGTPPQKVFGIALHSSLKWWRAVIIPVTTFKDASILITKFKISLRVLYLNFRFSQDIAIFNAWNFIYEKLKAPSKQKIFKIQACHWLAFFRKALKGNLATPAINWNQRLWIYKIRVKATCPFVCTKFQCSNFTTSTQIHSNVISFLHLWQCVLSNIIAQFLTLLNNLETATKFVQQSWNTENLWYLESYS